MADYGLMALLALIGSTWMIGSWLQFLVLRRQERLIRQLEQQSEVWCRRTLHGKYDAWQGDDPDEIVRIDERNGDRLIRPGRSTDY